MRRRLLVPIVMCTVASACASAGGGVITTSTLVPPGPHSPVVSLFAPAAGAGSGTAPALLTLAWSVSDPDGDPVTCRIDADGNSTVDFVIPNCQIPGSRNIALPNAGNYTASLNADDGNQAPVIATTTLTVAVPATNQPFSITVRPVTALSPAVQASFTQAVARWSTIVTRSLDNVAINLPAGFCVAGSAPLTGTISGVVIDVHVAPIDGPGGILGQSGPCVLSPTDNLPRVGDIEFDSADVTNMITAGTFDDVVLHEMAHVLGVGTLWNYTRSLLSGPASSGGPDPRYTGARAVAEYSKLGGTAGVPVEANGGPGTADAHWRESTFGTELLTGYINNHPNPLSALTVASLADLGYHVDVAKADLYPLPGPAALRAGPAPMTTSAPTMVLHGPRTSR